MEEQNNMPQQAGGNDVESNKAMAALSYIGILVLIPLLAKKDSPYAQFHSKQGLVLLIAEVITSIIMAIPLIGWIVGVVGSITWLVIAIMGIVAAFKGEQKELPIIGGFAKKMNM